MRNTQPGFGAPDPRVEDAARREALRSTEELTRWLDRVKGWEPGWLNQFMELDRGRVEVTRSVTRDGHTTISEERWEREGDRFAGWARQDAEPVHTWRIEPPSKRARVGTGPWVTTPIGPMRRLHGTDGHNGSRMSGIWQLSVLSRQTDPGGDVRVSWTRMPGGGHMHWIVEPGTWWLRRMEARSATGRLEWVEERAYEVFDGRVLMTHRQRRTFTEPGEVDDERIRWILTSGASALTMGEF